MLNKPEVKRGGIGDYLNAGDIAQVGPSQGDRRHVRQIDRLLVDFSEIGVRRAAVPDIPARVHVQMCEGGEPSDIFCPGRSTAGQNAEGVKVNRFGSLGFQVGVQKSGVTYFVQRVAGDVLGTIAVEELKRLLIIILRPVGDTSQLRVLRQAAYLFPGARPRSP